MTALQGMVAVIRITPRWRRYLAGSATVIVLLLFPQGCGGAGTVPVLQRFDALQPTFDDITSASESLRGNASRLDDWLRRGNVSQIKRSTVAIARVAKKLRTASGSAGFAIRMFLRDTHRGPVRTYFKAVLKALHFEWAEGTVLLRLSHIIWHDPLVTVPADDAAVRRLELAGRRDAWQAVQTLRFAVRWKAQHRGSFRYSPVHP